VESRENRSTAGGTRRREVLLSGRGPLSSLSWWWQVSVAALAAEDGRHRRHRQETFLSQSQLPSRLRPRLVCGFAYGLLEAIGHYGASRALHEREEQRRVCPPARRQATRTMSDATPRITSPPPPPPPRSDATATRYALRIRC